MRPTDTVRPLFDLTIPGTGYVWTFVRLSDNYSNVRYPALGIYEGLFADRKCFPWEVRTEASLAGKRHFFWRAPSQQIPAEGISMKLRILAGGMIDNQWVVEVERIA